MSSWLIGFKSGWLVAGQAAAAIVGGCCAVGVVLLILAFTLLVLGMVFNLSTDALARHWENIGKCPGGHWAQVIVRAHAKKK